jgi:cytidine deaminase
VNEIDAQELVMKAREVRGHAYAPYSRFKVGAAVVGASGAVYVGVNVENACYPAGICAECSAVSSAVASGETVIVACAVVTEGNEPSAPCGVCRQVLSEFGQEMQIFIAGVDPSIPIRTLGLKALLPEQFDSRALVRDTEPQ